MCTSYDYVCDVSAYVRVSMCVIYVRGRVRDVCIYVSLCVSMTVREYVRCVCVMCVCVMCVCVCV